LTKQLAENQASSLTPLVHIAKAPGTNNKISITISGQELFYSKLRQTFESMVRKAQAD